LNWPNLWLNGRVAVHSNAVLRRLRAYNDHGAVVDHAIGYCWLCDTRGVAFDVGSAIVTLICILFCVGL
jgi:hypothetical protein